MITEDINILPSDLKEYRAIPYYPDITTIEEFKENLEKTINEILSNPDKSDNPVQDRLPSIIESKEEQYLKEIEILNKKLTTGKTPKSKVSKGDTEDSARKRIERILDLLNAASGGGGLFERGPTWTVGEGEDEKEYRLPKPEDGFDYYYVKKGKYIDYVLIINTHTYEFNFNSDLADIRVMLSKYKESGSMRFKFVIGCNDDLSDKKELIDKFFNNAMTQAKADKKRFSYDIWDMNRLIELEKDLGIRL